MANKYAIRISKTAAGTVQEGSFLTLPTPDELTVSFQTLDSSKSGRNNNTGNMFRDKICEKLTMKITLPYGVSNTIMVAILAIIEQTSFYSTVIDPRTATYRKGDDALHVYCASAEPPIAEITSFDDDGTPTEWIYESFELTFVEM